MILNSRSYYSHEQLAFADFCRVLALPARVAVLEEVAVKKTCCEEELIEIGGMAPSTIREHLKELKKSRPYKGFVHTPQPALLYRLGPAGGIQETF